MSCVGVHCGAVRFVRQACVKPGPARVLGVSRLGKPLQDDGTGGTRRGRPRQGSWVMPRTIVHMAISYPWIRLIFLLTALFDDPVSHPVDRYADHPVGYPFDRVVAQRASSSRVTLNVMVESSNPRLLQQTKFDMQCAIGITWYAIHAFNAMHYAIPNTRHALCIASSDR